MGLVTLTQSDLLFNAKPRLDADHIGRDKVK